MDRFIADLQQREGRIIRHLKSNMDRFIGATLTIDEFGVGQI